MIIPLTEKVKVIRPSVPPRFPFSNSLFIDDEQKLMIDAGAGVSSYEELEVEKIDKLILSHYHFDHNHGYTIFKNAEIWAGEEERWAYENPEAFKDASGYDLWPLLMKDFPETRDTLEPHPEVLAERGFKAIPLTGTFREGAVFNTGEVVIEALHTPGHTPGHYAFYLPKENILFSSDLDISPRGPWYGGKFSDFDDLVHSVKRLMKLKPDILVTSHRRVFYDNIESLFKEFLGIALEREYRIIKYLKQPLTLEEIFIKESRLLPDEMTPNRIFSYKVMLLKHLKSLIKNKQIVKISENRYISVKESLII